jgi:RNA polymerase sporulation-specific sigma factor
LIWSVARRFIGRGTESDDLYQLGCLGFLKAVEGFDLEYGTQFSTYAVPKIAGEIRRFLRDDGAVKVSRTIKEQASTIRTARNHLATALGREPTISEISRQTGLTPEEIALAENATAATESIQQENGDARFSLENILTDTESEERMVERIALTQAISRLPERENLVIKLRYFHGLTQDRVAKVMQVSQVQVSRIEKKAIGHLRELLS